VRDDTLVALKAIKASKKLEIDEAKFRNIMQEFRDTPVEELWATLAPKAKASKTANAPADPVAAGVKAALSKYKASAAEKAESLMRFMLPHRVTIPKTMPGVLKVLKSEFSDVEIVESARELMARLTQSSGTNVPL